MIIEARMKLWKRLLATLVVMLAASLLAGLLWRGMFGAGIPSYLSGLVGGLAALGTWEFLRSN
jgi:hypothetical protein